MSSEGERTRQAIQRVVDVISDNLEDLDSSNWADEEVALLAGGFTVLSACWRNQDLDDTALEELLGTIHALNRVWCYHTGAGKLAGEYGGRRVAN